MVGRELQRGLYTIHNKAYVLCPGGASRRIFGDYFMRFSESLRFICVCQGFGNCFYCLIIILKPGYFSSINTKSPTVKRIFWYFLAQSGFLHGNSRNPVSYTHLL